MQNTDSSINPGPKEIGLRQKLENAFRPYQLAIQNESHKHKGHQGYGIESHFHVTIGCDAFRDKSTLICHRLIFDILKEEMRQDNPESIHALSLTIVK